MRHLSSSLLPALALVLVSTSLFACADSAETTEAQLRGAELSELWGLAAPANFPKLADCEQFWAKRCSALDADACEVAQSRLSCAQFDGGGVVVTDAWTEIRSAKTWRGYAKGDAGMAEVDGSATEACASMGGDPAQCEALAAIADAVASQHEAIYAASPFGGVASVEIHGDELALAPAAPSAGTLLGQAANTLGWTMPTFAAEISVAAPADIIVIEDMIMLVAGPNGNLSVSTGEIMFLQDNNWDDCVECDDTIDMYIEEFIEID